MRPFSLCMAAVVVLSGVLTALSPGAADDGETAREAAAVERGVSFLQKDASRWKAERQCATCHHGAITLWAFNEAARQGYTVDAAFKAETAQWTKSRLAGIEKPRDPRPGYNMISSIALYLAAMDRYQPGLGTLSAEERKQIAGHTARHLEADGSVLTPATMSPPLPQNGPPPFFESREVLTLLALLALSPGEPGGAGDEPAVTAARKRASDWLRSAQPGSDTQAAALRLLVDLQERQPTERIQAAIRGLLARQNADGGWGQLRSLPSDAYATGQALYVLGVAGVDRERPEIRKGVAFLMASQQEDGSWPMTPRAHSGAKPSGDTNPIRHFGSAWAVIGLARSVPK